ncbi:hypothetical protein GCM10025767_30260 [Thalassotalea piscium]
MQKHNCSEQLVIKIKALCLTVFTAYKIVHLINDTGISLFEYFKKIKIKNKKASLSSLFLIVTVIKYYILTIFLSFGLKSRAHQMYQQNHGLAQKVLYTLRIQ